MTSVSNSNATTRARELEDSQDNELDDSDGPEKTSPQFLTKHK